MMYYDMDGNRINLWQWVEYMEHDIMRRVAADNVGGYCVSTVFLGLNHNFLHPDLPPLIFETMIFDPAGEGIEQWRYPTKEAALAGHDQAVMWVREHAPA